MILRCACWAWFYLENTRQEFKCKDCGKVLVKDGIVQK